MYFPNVASLKQFYASPLGVMAQERLLRALLKFWPQASGDTILAIGFPTPYLEAYRAQGAQIVVCMPSQQGALVWPSLEGVCTVLAHEAELPLPDNAFNRVFLMHSLEQSEQLRGLMQEIWRVLTPGGRLIAVAPNRLSFWARSASSPFGYGRPFSLYQMKALLAESRLTYLRSASALFALPSPARWVLRSAKFIELVGTTLLPLFGGALIVEAEKQIYAAIKEPVARRVYVPSLGVPVPAPQPQPAKV